MNPYLYSYAWIAVSVAVLVGLTAWWTYSKYKRKAK